MIGFFPERVIGFTGMRNRDDAGRRAATTLEARALAQGIAATVLTPENGGFNDDLAAFGPSALAAQLALLLDPGP